MKYGFPITGNSPPRPWSISRGTIMSVKGKVPSSFLFRNICENLEFRMTFTQHFYYLFNQSFVISPLQEVLEKKFKIKENEFHWNYRHEYWSVFKAPAPKSNYGEVSHKKRKVHFLRGPQTKKIVLLSMASVNIST